MTTNSPEQTSWQIYRRLLGYTFSQWHYLLFGALALLIFSALNALIPYLLGPFIDNTYVDKNYDEIKWIPWAFLAIIILRGIVNFIGTYLIGHIGAYVIKALRREMFDRMQYFPARYFDHQATGEILSRFSFDVERVIGAAVKSLRSLIQDSSHILFLLGVMFVNNWKLTALFLVVTPLIALAVGYTSKLFRKFGTRMQKSVGRITHVVEESVIGHRIVKIFGGQQYEIDKFERVNEKYRRNNLRMIMTKAASTPIIQMLVGFALVAVLVIAARPAISAEETAGGFISFIVAMVWILTPARKLTLVNEILQTGIAAGKSVFALIDTDEEEHQSAQHSLTDCKGSIEYRDVCFRYLSRDDRALEHVDLEIEPGETVAFVGRSGSGKSTIVNLLPRFYALDRGDILIDGTNIQDLDLASLRAQIAIVSQEVVLFNDTIANNIAYAKNLAADDPRVLQAAQAAHVLEFTDKLPDGLNTLVGENGVLLSGGQRQRIAIARALLKDAPIMILDEATSSLDAESEKYIQDALATLQANRTTMIIAHRLSTIDRADRIVVMEKGRIVGVGGHDELIRDNAVYANLYKMQTRASADDAPAPVATTPSPRDVLMDLEPRDVSQNLNIGNIERLWYSENLLSALLLPLSWLFRLAVVIRKIYYRLRTFGGAVTTPFTIVVGNITVGGTGKTPFVIWLAQRCKASGLRVGIVARGYRRDDEQRVIEVHPEDAPAAAGDEALLLSRHTACPVVIAADRQRALDRLLAKHDLDVVLSDDGLQHYRLPRDVEIAVVDGDRKFGNGRCLPAGPLREPVGRLRSCDLVVHNGGEDARYHFQIVADQAVSLSPEAIRKPLEDFQGATVHAVAGTGNPARFFSLLQEAGINAVQHRFPDHHTYRRADLDFGDDAPAGTPAGIPILMTEKDAVKCAKFTDKNIWYVPVTLLPNDALEQHISTLIERIPHGRKTA